MFKNLILLLSFLSIISCQHIIDQLDEKKEQENFSSAFQGKYTGSYVGDINGALVVDVSKSAMVKVTRSTQTSSESYETSLVNSSFNTTSKAPSGFILYGNLNSKTGTWEMGDLKGTWNLVKN